MDQPTTTATTPLVCDMSTAPDTPAERMAEYRRLFTQVLVGRERTADGIRFRLRADEGVEAWVRDLAAREKACCPFFDSSITTVGDEVHWDATVVDDDNARAILEEFYNLPDTGAYGVEELEDRLSKTGLQVLTKDAGTVRPAHHDAATAASPTGPSSDS